MPQLARYSLDWELFFYMYRCSLLYNIYYEKSDLQEKYNFD